MVTLGDDWLTEKHIDFEYKKYVLLAFLQQVEKDFELQKLYPSLREIIKHYNQVKAIKERKEELYNSFPAKATDVDTEKMQLVYEKIFHDNRLMHELESIINFSIPHLENHLAEGKKIYDAIESQLNIFPVGVVPLSSKEGYLFIRDGKNADTNVYEYDITFFEQSDAKYRGIHTEYVKTWETDLSMTYQYIKLELLKEKQNIPNPATYAIESEWVVPLEETLLPIAKRCLLKFVENT